MAAMIPATDCPDKKTATSLNSAASNEQVIFRVELNYFINYFNNYLNN